MQRPHAHSGSVELHGVKQAVHRAPRRLVGAFHRREVGMRAHVVGRQKQVRNGGGRLGTQRPGVDEVHQQRLGILQEARACGIAARMSGSRNHECRSSSRSSSSLDS